MVSGARMRAARTGPWRSGATSIGPGTVQLAERAPTRGKLREQRRRTPALAVLLALDALRGQSTDRPQVGDRGSADAEDLARLTRGGIVNYPRDSPIDCAKKGVSGVNDHNTW